MASRTVHSAGEMVKNGEQVRGKFPLWVGCQHIVENHDLSVVLFNEELEKVKSESDKAVTVGNHKREFLVAQDSSQ